MLADPDFGRMVQAIGQASLGADEKTIWHLTKVYCERPRGRDWRGRLSEGGTVQRRAACCMLHGATAPPQQGLL